MDPRKIRDKRVIERNLRRGIFILKEVEEAKRGAKNASRKAAKLRIKLEG